MSSHPYLTDGTSKVLAHRGASGSHPPGNTWTAFRAAADAGVDHIETDVRCTADGRLVLFHNDDLDDTTTGSGAISTKVWAEISDLRYVVDGVPTDEPLVLLDDLILEFPSLFFNIDAKTDEVVDPLVELLTVHDMQNRVCVAAFGWRRIRRIRRLLGDRWCTALSKPEIALLRAVSWLRLPFRSKGAVAQIPLTFKGVRVADARLLDTAHQSDMAVHVWTINKPDLMEDLLDHGFDGVITDRPEAALDHLKSR